MQLPITWSWLVAAFVSFDLITALNVTVYQPGVPWAPSPLPPSHAESDGSHIVELFENLGRTTVWKLVEKVKFQGDTYEPEGILRLGPDRYYVSAGEYTVPTEKYNTTINGTVRTAGAGFAHIIIFNGNGSRIADVTLTANGAEEYHNGGLDYDGKYIWATIAQYRPNSTAHVLRIDPSTIESKTILHYDDHEGGIVHSIRDNTVTTLNWGSRNASTFSLSHLPANPSTTTPQPVSTLRNPSYYIDYQDCKFRGYPRIYHSRPVMICSGVATISTYTLGGLAIVDLDTMLPLMEVPLTMVSDLNVTVTQNPMDVSVSEDGILRAFFLPDQHNSTLYVYEAQIDSPFEFGGGLDM